ncbi:peptidoglycan recognition protein family protein [Streptomyces nodosus]
MSKIVGMRGYLASSIGVSCTAALALSFALPAAAAGPRTPGPGPDPVRGVSSSEGPARAAVPGSTRSLALGPLTPDRAAGGAPEEGLAPRTVPSFSLVGVVWDDPGTELHGHVQIRTRLRATNRWSAWQEVENDHHGHGPDPGTAEGRSHRMRGATAPLWVGDSDGVEVRVRAEAEQPGGTRVPALPDGLRVELVDPGTAVGAPGQAGRPASTQGPDGGVPGLGSIEAAVDAGLAPLKRPVLPALPATADVLKEVPVGRAHEAPGRRRAGAESYTAPRPRIVTRSGWGADENLRESGFVYTGGLKAAFVHHTATGNNYTCAQAPSVIRSIYRYHVVSSGWRDIGYNFLIDKCGNIYEGRAGGVDKPVMGAHTLGFNSDTTGIAVLGTYTGTAPSAAAVDAVAAVSAWKLGLYGVDPRGRTYLQSAGGNLYPKGENARLNVISGHRDGFATECPGKLLYDRLGSVRSTAARLQGR